MYSKFKLAQKYFWYYVTALNGRGHGIHSPFVFDFVINVLNDKRQYYSFEKIEALRIKLLNDHAVIEVEDFGAGSVKDNKKQRSIGNIAKLAAKPAKLGQLLFRIVNYYQPQTIVELGTSLGMSTSYLASGNANSSVITMEGAPAIAQKAKENFHLMGLQNVQIITGNFDETLLPTLSTVQKVDLAFIDGNHRKKPTLDYFNAFLQKVDDHSILIFDDIHWSQEMEEAWEEIKNHEAVQYSIDLFFIGLVFFRKDFKRKQDFVIRF